jgi:hypothetical protein
MKGLHISCIITGEEKYFTKAGLENKLKKFGTQEILEKYYVSKPAAKLLKQGHSVDQVRTQLNSKLKTNVDYEVLYKLKLLKKSKNKKQRLSKEELAQQLEQTRENERKYYEHKEKMLSCKKTWVEWATGGTNGGQIPYGGTCIRPDIYYDNEGSRDGRCKPCPYNEFCLCTNKEVV